MSGSLNGGGIGDLRSAANLSRQEQLILSERAKEQSLQTRVTSLQLAVQVVGVTSDPSKVLGAAELFRAFISNDGQPPTDGLAQ